MGKSFSILISAVFIVTLISSSPLSSVRTLALTPQQTHDFLYSIKVSPTFVKVQQGEFGIFDVQVARGSNAGQFLVDLSLIADSPQLKAAASFSPAKLSFEEGQTTMNATLKINSYGIDPAFLRFRVAAATQTSSGSDEAQSNPAALIVSASVAKQSSDAVSGSPVTDSNPASGSTTSGGEQKTAPEIVLTKPKPKPNNPPVAKAGLDQVVKEGDKVTLDSSASTDPDKDPISYSWQQISPRGPSIKLHTSPGTQSEINFIAPDVDKDTTFKFKVTVKDSKGGLAADYVNILVKNVAEPVSGSTPSKNTPQQTPNSQQEQPNTGQTTKVENHSPTAELQQALSTSADKALPIILKGNDADENDKLSYVIVTSPSHGTLAGFDKTSGSLTYMPSSGFSGQDKLVFKVVDSHNAESNTGAVSITVSASEKPSSPSSSSSSPSSSQLSSSTPKVSSNGNESSNALAQSTSDPASDTTKGTSIGTATSTSGIANNNTSNSSNSNPNYNTTNTINPSLTSSNVKTKTLASSAVSGEVYAFVFKWGSQGTGTSQFNNPHALATDSSGNVYVIDSGNNRVQKFGSDGHFITQWGGFKSPQGIAVDRTSSSGSVFVVDTGNNLVKKFTNSGTPQASWGSKGTGNGQFDTPSSAAVDSSGFLYVTDTNNKRITKFQFASSCPSGTSQVVAGVCFVTKWGSNGNSNGKFNGPHGIAVDSGFNVYVVDYINNNVQKFTNTGGFLLKWGSGGSGNGQFNSPHGVSVDSDGSVYVTDRGNNRVQKFGNTGGFLTKWGSSGTGDGQFNGPDGIGVGPGSGSSGNVYVTDVGNNRVQVFAIDTTAPAKPVILVPADGTVTNNTKIPLSGTAEASSNINVYDGATPIGTTTTTAAGSWSFTPTTPLSDGIHSFTVTATDGGGNTSPPSDAISVTVDTVVPAAVAATPKGGLYNTDQSVTLAFTFSEPSTSKIFYTTDGTTPTSASNLYSTPVAITAESLTTLKFRGIDAAGNAGAVGTELYTIDKTTPTVLSTEPATGAIDVPVNAKINATFSEAMDIDGSAGNFSVLAEDGVTPVDGTVSWSADNTTATFTPTTNLVDSPSYTVTIKGATGGIKDKAGNPMTNDYSWSFSTPAKITLTLDPTSPDGNSPKWGHDVKVTGTVTGAHTGPNNPDKISIDWGDGSTLTEIPVPTAGQPFQATHTYDISAMLPNPQKIVVAKLLTSLGVERAVSGQVSLTLQKHATKLTAAVKDGTANGGICISCQFTALGMLNDTDTTPNVQVNGKTISFSGSGVPPTLNSVQTAGVKFSGTPANNLTVTGGRLHLPVGTEISLPSATRGVTYTFGDGVDLSFTKSDDSVQTKSEPSGSGFFLDSGLKKITITGVSGGSTAELVSLETGDPDTGFPETDTQISIGSNVAPDGDYPTLTIEPGSYFSTGTSQAQDGNGLTVTAAFNDANDPAYLTSTAQVTYDVGFQFGVGEGTATAYNGVTWTKLNVGSGIAAGDACTDNGVAGTDNDKDGICDRWEDPNNVANGNDGAHRYITCPTNAGPTAMDAACPTANKSIKYNLCFPDAFASASGKADGSVICPTLGHKDIYVEIDYMANHAPSTNAIKNVIKAFGNSPVSNCSTCTDGFGIKDGITLHVIVSDQFARTAPFNVWTGTAPSFNSIKTADWGTAAERGGTSGMPGMTAAGWTSTGKTLKHYAYHYGQWITYYGGSCTSAGLSSGLAELLGNDLVVSLGCGFGGSDPSGGSVGTDDQQAGTFMHELGHNLNLGHGGASTLAIGSVNYNTNCKPNYLSVMNYARQMPNAILDAASWESLFNWKGTGTQTSLDYARATIPNLLEGTAPESTVMTASDAKKYWIEYGTPTKVPAVRKVLTGAAVDWDGSGGILGTPSVDLNVLAPTVAGCGPVNTPTAFPNSPDLPQTLNSYSDWDKLNLVFTPDGDSQDGVTQKVSKPFLNPNTRELKPIFLESIQNEVNQIQFIPPPNPDGSTTFNTGSTVPLKFLLKDKNGNPIANAAVTLVTQKGTDIPIVKPGTFTYDPATTQYKYTWNTSPGNAGAGVWTLSYIMNYGSTNPALPPTLLQGPNAEGPYTLKITGVK